MNRNAWNKKVSEYAPKFGAFLQSWDWGEFQRSVGREVERVYLNNDGEEVLAQAIKMDLPLGQFFWFMPKGPLGSAPKEKMFDMIREELDDGMFYRIEPKEASRMLKVKDRNPATTLLLDLTATEDEILGQMKSKTRYNVRLSERKGVVSKFVDLDRFEDFVRLMEQTSKRDRIRPHPFVYYKTMLEVLSGGDVEASLAMSFYEGHPIAADIIIDFDGTRTYLHGATSNLHRNVMAQYGLHWFLMKDAKQKGMHTFDFHGIAPEGASESHSWSGITRYKKGFGGKIVDTPGTFELPTKHILYSIFRLVKKIRK